MKLPNTRGQGQHDPYYDVSGTVTAGGTPQLILPVQPARSHLFIQNISPGDLYFEFGSARARATLTSGVVSALTILNPGFNFTRPPIVEFMGGGQNIGFGNSFNSSFTGAGAVGYPSPSGISPAGATMRPARARCVLTTGAVTSFRIDDGGAGYVIAPYVWIRNDLLDPNGCADPSNNSGSGIYLASGQSYYINGTACPTDSLAVYGASTSQAFTVKYTD